MDNNYVTNKPCLIFMFTVTYLCIIIFLFVFSSSVSGFKCVHVIGLPSCSDYGIVFSYRQMGLLGTVGLLGTKLGDLVARVNLNILLNLFKNKVIA